jgi:hypothetical protein
LRFFFKDVETNFSVVYNAIGEEMLGVKPTPDQLKANIKYQKVVSELFRKGLLKVRDFNNA